MAESNIQFQFTGILPFKKKRFYKVLRAFVAHIKGFVKLFAAATRARFYAGTTAKYACKQEK